MVNSVNHSHVGDRFVLENIAGSGGMGTVYRAWDEQTNTAVAVKLLRGATDGESAERFIREAEVLAGLDHPGIVRYVAHGVTDEDAPFLAMEWLDGEDLAKRLTRGPMSFSEVLVLARCAADALGFAHAHGIVHRDIKPSNVFLRGGSVGDVALLDFGIAHINTPSDSLTATGDFIGTPAYVAPEQARGARDVGPAADVFSLGCILHECITGQQVFGGGNIVAILAKILLSTPPRIRDIRRNVPDAIDMLLRRMLERDPALRLPNGRAVLDSLEAIEPVSLDTMDRGPVVSSRRFGAGDLERQLICVLLASLERLEDDATLDMADEVNLFDVADEVRKFGAWAETLADGSLVATFAPTRGAATDQAAIAARAALLLKGRWPAISVVLCTGRAQVQGMLPMGDVLDRAANLLRNQVETADHVVIDDMTRRLLGARFRMTELAPNTCLLTSEESTLDPTRPLLGKPTPCVGRESELSLLDIALNDAIENESPHAVLVIAAPGTGKSRLRHEFMRRAETRDSPPLVLLGRGDPMSVGSAYGILSEAFMRCAGIAEGEALPVRRQKLMERVARHVQTDLPRVTAFLGEMCGIPFYDDDPKLRAARQDPATMADQVMTAFLDFLRAECKASPVVLVLEDLHWGDDLSVKVVEAALRELNDLPFMVLALARPEVMDLFPKLWQNRVQTVTLRPLSRKAGEKLIRQVLGKNVSDEMVNNLVEQSEGNALFLEELIRNVAEGHGEEAPATVLAMLQARIGRLEPHVRRILRCASIFGETSWAGGIRSLFGTIHSVSFEDGLRSLVRAEILELRRESRFPGEQEYRFRHGLMRDAAYGLLADEDRIEGHQLAAEYLESMHEQDSLVVAEHFVQGQEPARAVAYLLRAAEVSCDNGDMSAALHVAERALVLDPDPASRGMLLAIKTRVCVWREQYVEILKWGHEALALVEVGGYRWCQLVQQMMPAAAFTGQIEVFFKLATNLLTTDPPLEACAPYVAAVSWVSITSGIMGKRDICELFLSRAKEVVAYCQPNDNMAIGYYHCARANHHHVVHELPWSRVSANLDACNMSGPSGVVREECLANVFHAKALMDMGAIEESEKILRKNLAWAKQINERMALGYSVAHLARLLARHGTMEQLDEAAQLAQMLIATNNQSILGFGYGVLADIARRRNDLTLAEAEGRKAVAAMQRFPTYSWDIVALLTSILVEAKRPDEALVVGQEGLAKLEHLKVSGFGEIHLRLAVAEALYAAGRTDDALSSLTKALYQLRSRLDDIPDAKVRERYLNAVPVHARLLSLAREWFPRVDMMNILEGPAGSRESA